MPETEPEKPININLRFLVRNGVKYFRQDDILHLLLAFASTEDGDVRNRVNDLVLRFYEAPETPKGTPK